jgi:hypothetical protein
MREKKFSKETIRRQRIDRERTLRVVKYIDYPFVLTDCPVELEEGYIVTDRISCDVFASFVFKNVSEMLIKRLDIRLACYQNQNIPYLNIDFTYSQDELTFGVISKNGKDMKLKEANQRSYIGMSESFGSCVFVPIPESYFTKMDIIIRSVEFVNGEKMVLNKVVAGDTSRYNDLDDISKIVYSRVNIYQAAEERFPTVVIPQFNDKVWLCCCGNKNPNACDECEKCGREKKWQQENISQHQFEKTREKLVNDPREITLHDKSKFKQNKLLENDAEVQKKIEQYEEAIKNIAREEKIRERRTLMLVPKIAIALLIIAIIAFAIRLFSIFRPFLQQYVDSDVSIGENVGNVEDMIGLGDE